jgi:excisionase family DNA binding protein
VGAKSLPRRSSPTLGQRRLISTEEAAERLGVSKKTIVRWIKAGRLVGFRVGPRYIRVDANELEAAMVRRIPTVVGGHDDAA